MNEEFPEDSDSSDEDYVPAGAAGEVLSEVDSDGDPEDPLSDAEDDAGTKTKRRKRTTKKKPKEANINESESMDESKEEAKKEMTAEEKKKHADDLWASFKKDTGIKKKESTTTETTSSEKKAESKVEPKKIEQPETVKITQVFEFAGEEVKVEKEVKADSAEARLANSQPAESSPAQASSNPSLGGPPKRKAGLGGIGSVLNQIGKKQKLTTLEKTKLDWNRFKSDNKIEDELEAYKKGKDGYLERQDFLQRADVRQFEIERDIRNIERNKRFNNAP